MRLPEARVASEAQEFDMAHLAPPFPPKRKFLVQASTNDDIVTQEQPWFVEEAESPEELAEKYLRDPQIKLVRVMPYLPLRFARGIQCLNRGLE
jgi:hypothetical protein